MEVTNTTPVETPAVHDSETKKKDSINSRRNAVIAGCILTLLGWALMMFMPWFSLAFTVAGLVTSIIGVRIPAGPRRNLAITSIIASAVLLVVFIAFYVLLYVLA